MDPILIPHLKDRGKKSLKLVSYVAVLAVVLLVAQSCVFIVGPEAAGTVRTFGRVTTMVGPGIGFKLPYPIQQLDTVNVKQVRRVELGYRTIRQGPPGEYRDLPEESLMLTGDENIADVTAAVQFVVSDVTKYMFYVDNPESAVQKAAESALREVVGRYTIDDVLVNNKQVIQDETKRLLQGIVDEWRVGVTVTSFLLQDVYAPREVRAAFSDVASAKEDKQRYINQALGYQSDLIPRARGEAAQIVAQAEGKAQSRVLRAQGDVLKFDKMYSEYRLSKEVTRTRLYLEAMEQVLAGKQIYVVTKDGNNINYIPLMNHVGGATNGR